MNETTVGGADGAGRASIDGATRGDGEPPTIVAEGVRKAYGDVVALDGVDLAVDAGEVFGLIGPNGAGKTTLVRALTGTTAFDGRVRVFGVGPDAVDPQRIGLLPQSFDPPERLTARELVAYYGGLYDESRDVEAVLRDVGLANDADAWYETLSGGQRRRTCVATALVNDPDLLFLDEPTTGIDPAGRRSIHGLIEGLADAGTTVFLTSHAMDEVERLADRVALLRDGAIVAVGAPERLIADHGGEPRLEVVIAGDEAAGSGGGEPGGETMGTGGEESDGEEATQRATQEVVDEVADGIADGSAVEVSATPAGLRFVGVRPEGIGEAVAALEAAGVGFESLSWSEPTLEDVYLRLTGEAYSPRAVADASVPASAEVVDR
ncbi:ATP-binding cassette domain-containing protein [Halorubrum sp. JWXQ-INN 858]|uniref:ABC transporter ATP-binding protein n=1 Tax=Halorubrum sp. JWXQ-INN 858 TaxID=2690782 RepID=UPI0013574364|nr:ABC transporter ATP-binding protein [Halorubrum sp. JWXQ-INN 858]MWV65315.1 ATP-binding cassette domain-containing protein [Halorubrum sp. JWXQ-INN 858]